MSPAGIPAASRRLCIASAARVQLPTERVVLISTSYLNSVRNAASSALGEAACAFDSTMVVNRIAAAAAAMVPRAPGFMSSPRLKWGESTRLPGGG